MRRILLVLTVALVMVAMMVVTVAPAFAARPAFHPTPTHGYPNQVSSCAEDPVCVGDIQIGQSHHERFPRGQHPGPPE